MQLGGKQSKVKKVKTHDKTEHLCDAEDIAECENVSEMDFSESPRSSTSMEFAEFSSPSQSNEDNDDNDDSSSATEELVVNLPAGLWK